MLYLPLMVVLFHAPAAHSLFMQDWFRHMAPILDFFFMLSGFVMALGFRDRIVASYCIGTRRLYDFVHENPIVDLEPVDWVNDPRIIGSQPDFVSINATTEIDLMGQCASETIGGRLWSGSGGQADFARGAMYSPGGQGFIACRSTAAGGTVSRIVGRLAPGSIVTTVKNTVDTIVTEHGVAELRGRSVRERATALIAVAEPEFRDRLAADARELGYL